MQLSRVSLSLSTATDFYELSLHVLKKFSSFLTASLLPAGLLTAD